MGGSWTMPRKAGKGNRPQLQSGRATPTCWAPSSITVTRTGGLDISPCHLFKGLLKAKLADAQGLPALLCLGRQQIPVSSRVNCPRGHSESVEECGFEPRQSGFRVLCLDSGSCCLSGVRRLTWSSRYQVHPTVLPPHGFQLPSRLS